MKKKFTVAENSRVKILCSENYNYTFNKESGAFARWGKTREDDPEYCTFGPEILDIEISTICSKACAWCYKGNTGEGTYMSFETFQKIFDKIPNTVTQIAFGIGDISGNPDQWKIMQYCRDNGVVPNVTINGDHMTEENYKNLAKYCGAVAVSHYDDETCFNAVRKLTDLGMKQINIHKLLTEETFKDCMILLTAAEEEERLVYLNAIVFLWLKPKGPRNILTPLLTLDKYKLLVDYVLDREIRIGFDSCSASPFTKCIQGRPEADQISQHVDSCESTCFSYYINVDGIGYPCSFCEGEEGFAGINLLTMEDFSKEVWYAEETKMFRDRLMGNKDCNGCRQCPTFNLTVECGI